jgi:hypothetical protein
MQDLIEPQLIAEGILKREVSDGFRHRLDLTYVCHESQSQLAARLNVADSKRTIARF